MSGLVRGLLVGAVAWPVLLVALALLMLNFWTVVAVVGALVAVVVAAALLHAWTAPEPVPAEPTFERRARGAPLEPEG